MRYLRIFLLYFENVLEYRSVNLVWFLVSLINPLILLLYWVGFYHSQGAAAHFSDFRSVTTYYFLLVIASSLLMSHVEEEVAYDDIQLGELIYHLMKPFSYFVITFISEIPWRVVQSIFGGIVLISSLLIFGDFIDLPLSFGSIFMGIVISILAYIMSFIFKMIIGITAFWFVEFSGFNQLIEVVILLFGGYIMPLHLYSGLIKTIAYFLPFAYMIYFPVISFQGMLSLPLFCKVVSVQLFWITLLLFVFRYLWKKGLHQFTGVGN